MSSRRLFEFVCREGHRSEQLAYPETQEIVCPICAEASQRVISPVRSKLEGITGDFPTAYSAWERKHKEATAVARKRKLSQEGPDA